METMQTGIKKPNGSDYVTRAFFNGNWDALDNRLTDLDKKVATRDILAGYMSDMFTPGVRRVNSDFNITYHSNMTIDIGLGVAYENGYRINYEGGTVDISPFQQAYPGQLFYVHIRMVESYSCAYNPEFGIPGNYTGIFVWVNFNSNQNIPGIPLYEITIAPPTTRIVAVKVDDWLDAVPVDLRTQIVPNY